MNVHPPGWQLHNWTNYDKTEAEKRKGHTPSVDEVCSMAWQCICEGATGLVFYIVVRRETTMAAAKAE